jgi:AAA15 family ATPase/GTPase
MEALLFMYVDRKKADFSSKAQDQKKATDYILKQANNLKSKTNIYSISFEYDNSNTSSKFSTTINNYQEVIAESEFDVFLIIKKAIIRRGICWIGSFRDSQQDIISSFIAIQEKDREDDLNRFVNSFDSEIEKVKVIGESIQCRVTASDGSFFYRDISEYGDGLRHYISVIADMFAAENGYVFIDEIDNGIHYTAMDKFWDIILMLSKNLNVQVFATTHSKECIEAYYRAIERHEARDISLITLVKNKDKEIKAIIRDYETFTNSINEDREVRGW